MNANLSPDALRSENRHYRGSGARSQENRSEGFRPAFRDSETAADYGVRSGDGLDA